MGVLCLIITKPRSLKLHKEVAFCIYRKIMIMGERF